MKVESTNKECADTKARALFAKADKVEDKLAQKRYKKIIDHKSKVMFKISCPNAFNPTFKEHIVSNNNPPMANIA